MLRLSASLLVMIFLFSGVSLAGLRESSTSPRIDRYVIIYMENHSFDNRYGGWEGVNGRQGTYVPQVNQYGGVYACLAQTMKSLTSPPLPVTCVDAANNVLSAFQNQAFAIAPYQRPCHDLTDCNEITLMVHRFYQEQYQINKGAMNRFVVASDAVGATVNFTDTQTLPIYKLLHEGRPGLNYAVLDNFFHAALGGSFLNHQWLISARTPVWANAVNDGGVTDRHSVIDINGMPNSANSQTTHDKPPLYQSPATYPLYDRQITASCNPPSNRGPTPPGFVCGDFAVNTTLPGQQPFAPDSQPFERLPLLTTPNIGDALSQKKITWAWYAGGWSNANGDSRSPGWTNGHEKKCGDPHADKYAVFPFCPDDGFSFHHQPFNYYKTFDRTTAKGKLNRRIHLRDEQEFITKVSKSKQNCLLPKVSFVKPLTSDSEHSRNGYDLQGSRHLSALVSGLAESACINNAMIIVTYDENGGEFDHVAPPGQGNTNGPFDQWGPGSRVPTLIISPSLRPGGSVDHTQYDTTSILSTLEHTFGITPLNSRDALVNPLFGVFINSTPLSTANQ